MDESDDTLHRGAVQVAKRVLGNTAPESIRTVRRWSSESSERPEFIIKVGGRICAWESAIRRHAATAQPRAAAVAK